MQRDDWYASARAPPSSIRAEARRRATPASARCAGWARARSRPCRCRCCSRRRWRRACSGISSSAVSGGSLYRKSSFLLDSLGKQVFSPHGGDHRATRTSRAAWPAVRSTTTAWRRSAASVVEGGVLQGYFLGSYSARKLGMKTTGNAGGNHNLILNDTGERLRGAAEEDGPRPAGHRTDGAGHQHGHRRLFARRGRLLGRKRRDSPIRWRRSPSPAICKDMFRGIVAVGNDVLERGSKQLRLDPDRAHDHRRAIEHARRLPARGWRRCGSKFDLISREQNMKRRAFLKQAAAGVAAGAVAAPAIRAIAAGHPVAPGLELSEEPRHDLRHGRVDRQARRGDHRRQIPDPRVCGRRNRAGPAGARRGAERHRRMRSYRVLLLRRQGSGVRVRHLRCRSA